MSIRRVFRENLPLEVFEPGQEIYYKSIIQEVDDDYIAIGIPMRNNDQLFMHKNSTWEFRLYKKDTLYFFRSRCLGHKKEDQISLYLIEWPDEVRRLQRREFFRFPCSFDAHYWILKKPWNADDSTLPDPLTKDRDIKRSTIAGKEEPLTLKELKKKLGEPEEAMLGDISGGGLQLIAPKWLPIDTVLFLAIYLKSKKKEKTIFVKGKVVWVGPHEPERIVRFRHAVEYEDTSEQTKEEIVGFIFVLMRERML